MKICFVTTGDIKYIAAAKRALGMANPLSTLGWQVHILLEDAPENHIRAQLECSSKINIHYFPKSTAIKEVQIKNELIKQINPDYLFICAFVFRNIVSSNKLCKKLVEHSELQSGIPDIKGLKKVFTWLIEYFSLIYADGLLCASKYLEKVYTNRNKRIFHNTPILYYPYAFSPEICQPKTYNNLPSKFTNLLDKKNFIFMGSITHNYGLFTMLEAFRCLLNQHKDIRLILLGNGIHYNEALDYIKANKLENGVSMPGYIDEEDITNYFSIATAFLSPMNDTVQDWARCPSKLFMYLPFQKPVITCKIGEPYELFKDKGYYYESGSSESLISIVETLISGKTNRVINLKDQDWKYRTIEFNNWINNKLHTQIDSNS